MSNIDKQAVQAVADLKAGYNLGHADVVILNELARIALASLEAEPDYYVVVTSVGVWQSFCKTRAEAEFIVSKPFNPGYSIREIYTTPPAPVSVPDRSMFEKWWESEHGLPLDSWDSLRTTDGYCDDGIDGQFEAWIACRAAMLQGAEHSKMSGIMPDYEGGVMTQRECFQAGWEAHHVAMLQAGAPVQFGWSKGHFCYHTLFNAIGKAVKIQGGALSISVSAFENAMLAAAPQQEVKP